MWKFLPDFHFHVSNTKGFTFVPHFNTTVGHYINHNLTAQNHWEMKFNTWLNHGQPQPHTIAHGRNPGTLICLTLVPSKMLYLLNISDTHQNSSLCYVKQPTRWCQL